ncbi:spermidine synthase [Thalassotalea piscium]
MDIKGTLISSTSDEHGPIYVYQNRTSRILSFDGKIYQSSMKLNNTNGLHLSYTQAMMAGLLFIPKIHTATLVGLGAGSMVKSLLSSFSDIQVHAIECRESVVKAAKEYFFIPETERLTIHVDNGINYMKNTQIKSDIIFSDLYNSDGMEPMQVDAAYLECCKKALNKQGILVLNIWHNTIASKDELDKLLAMEFKNRSIVFDVESGNTIALLFKNELPTIDIETLIAKTQWLEEKMNISIEKYVQLIAKNLG